MPCTVICSGLLSASSASAAVQFTRSAPDCSRALPASRAGGAVNLYLYPQEMASRPHGTGDILHQEAFSQCSYYPVSGSTAEAPTVLLTTLAPSQPASAIHAEPQLGYNEIHVAGFPALFQCGDSSDARVTVDLKASEFELELSGLDQYVPAASINACQAIVPLTGYAANQIQR